MNSAWNHGTANQTSVELHSSVGECDSTVRNPSGLWMDKRLPGSLLRVGVRVLALALGLWLGFRGGVRVSALALGLGLG